MSQSTPASGQKCKHAACRCSAQPGKDFCSDYCERAAAQAGQGAGQAASAQQRCNCGHASCA
ncbi:MAG: hypothetical protein IT531_17815 [Burkholderiales bacterium]|nr:hypothetical protein [Burkholderiales bacterium]